MLQMQARKEKKLTVEMKPLKRFNKSGMKYKRGGEDNEEYIKKREKNNAAVKRARQKAKEKSEQTNLRIQSIRTENQELEERIKALSAELSAMKDMYSKYTGETYQHVN